MSAWVMSIVGVICLGILLEIVLPQGKSAKYVKGAFSLLVIFVIASPLPTLLKKDWKMDFSGEQFSVDSVFVQQTKDMFINEVQQEAEEFLALNGYDATVKAELDKDSINKICRIDVSLRVGVHDADNAGEDSDKVKQLLSVRFKVDKDKIFVSVREDGYGDRG